MKLSVIIPTINRRDKLWHIVTDLREQDFPVEEYEIVIADDGSDLLDRLTVRALI